MHSFFSVENKLFYYIGKVTDVLWISLLWVVFSIPVVTIGPSTTALYYTVMKCIREGENSMTEKFFRAFKENFKTGMIAGVLLEVLFLVLWLGCDRVADLGGPAGKGAVVLAYAFFVLILFLMGIVSYAFPLLAHFEFKPGELLVVAFQLAVRHFPSTVVMVAVIALSMILSVFLWIPVFMMPALSALLCSFLLERIFKKYLPSSKAEEGSM